MRTFLGLLSIGVAALAVPSQAAPLPGEGGSIGTALRAPVTEIRWWGHYYYGPRVYVGPDYYYGPPPAYYAPPPPVYVEPPAYYAPPPRAVYAPPPQPNGPVRQCWVATDKDRGYGYWHPC